MIALLLFLALVTPSLHLASGPPQLGGGRSVSDDLSEVRALVDKGDLPEAEALILELIARDEKDPAPRALLARVYLARAEKLRSSPLPDAGFAHMLELDALAALEKATELGSDDPTAWVDLAALFRDSGDLRKAREAAIRAEELSWGCNRCVAPGGSGSASERRERGDPMGTTRTGPRASPHGTRHAAG